MMKHNEITLLLSSGISFKRINVSLYLSAIILALIFIFLNQSVIPNLIFKAELVAGNTIIPFGYIKTKYSKGIYFSSNDDKRKWKIDSVSNLKTFNDVLIKNFDDDGNLKFEIDAKKASFSNDIWKFYDSKITFYEIKKLYNGKVISLPQKPFEIQYLTKESDFGLLLGITETATDIANFGKEPDRISTRDIISSIDRVQFNQNINVAMRMELVSRVIEPVFYILYVAIGGAFAFRYYRKNIILLCIASLGFILSSVVFLEFLKFLSRLDLISPLIAYLVCLVIIASITIYLNRENHI